MPFRQQPVRSFRNDYYESGPPMSMSYSMMPSLLQGYPMPYQMREPEKIQEFYVDWTKYKYDNGRIPKYFSWVDSRKISAVKRQNEQCRSCWAYAVSALVEAMHFIEHGQQVDISEDELLYCYQKGICNSTSAAKALAYGYEHGFSTSDSFHHGFLCPVQGNIRIRKLYYLEANEKAIARFISTRGPVILHSYMDVPKWQHFPGGAVIPNTEDCSSAPVNHAVLAVGFGEENGKKFWILKNSWGTQWGEDGYYRLERGTNACSCETYPIGVSVHPREY